METISVTELNRRARQALERALPLLWITGEISNLVRAASGHAYFMLKDEQAQVRCVMFRSRCNLVPWQLANGQQVEVQALVSIYEARGDFQLNVESMRRGGLGRLFEAFAKLRDKLEAEGLFAVEHKRPLPCFPRALGIVTSLQAVGILLVVAMLVTPGCTARLLTDRFDHMLIVAVVVTVLASCTGVYISFYINGATGACIVIAQALLFSLALVFAPKHGLIASRRSLR